ncbi:hypothetical protein JCM8202_003940 [Rhodotorula sphaerocarpa]
MASIAQLIGWDPATHSALDPTAALAHAKPDDFPRLADDAKDLETDLRTAYARALAHKEQQEHAQDAAFLERASEFVHLHDQVEASAHLLDELSAFLSTFQRDLSDVSDHISDLQGRSKTIEARLAARKAVERSLQPFVGSITLPPSLIATITESDIDDKFIAAVYDLDARLGAIRGGARVESRRSLDDAAEGLRLTATAKILPHLVSLLRPYTTSIAPSLPLLHTRLLALKPLFDFLRRHAARQAHEFQKAYAQTVRWYLETAFRRYVRALEKIRTGQPQQASDPIGVVNAGVDASLALLQQRRSAQTQARARPSRGGPSAPSATLEALKHARIDGNDVIQAHQANDRTFHPPPEELFRSCALVLATNAAAEYAFISTFFGQHSTLEVVGSGTAADGSRAGSGAFRSLRRSTTNGSLASVPIAESEYETSPAGVGAGRPGPAGLRKRESFMTQDGGARRNGTASVAGSAVSASRAAAQEDKVQRVVVEGLWKQVLEPALEYTRDFMHALLDPVPPAMIPLLAMVRLNDALLTALASPDSSPLDARADDSTQVPTASSLPAAGLPPCPALEPHLLAVRMQLLPILSKLMSAHTDSLRRINGSPAAGSGAGGGGGGVGGMFARATAAAGGGTGGAVKDSVVKVVIGRYAELFHAAVALWNEDLDGEGLAADAAREGDAAAAAAAERRRSKPVEGDDEMVFASLLRLRREVDKLLVHQASKQSDPAKQRAFMVAHCEELLHDLSAGLTSHARTQAEIAHYRELGRKGGS